MTQLTKLGTWKGAYPNQDIQTAPQFPFTFALLLVETATKINELGANTDASDETNHLSSKLPWT